MDLPELWKEQRGRLRRQQAGLRTPVLVPRTSVKQRTAVTGPGWGYIRPGHHRSLIVTFQLVDKSSIGAYQFDRYADSLFICHNGGRIEGSVIKFGFKIKVRNGMVVDNLMFMAGNRVEAEHKVKQIYRR